MLNNAKKFEVFPSKDLDDLDKLSKIVVYTYT